MVLKPLLKGRKGEDSSQVTRHMFLDTKEYHSFNNLILSGSAGSTQIDHVIVSRFVIFVIELKEMSGRISGGERDEKWTHTYIDKEEHFQNPLLQNYRHTRTIADFLRLDHEKVVSVVVFWGDCEFMTGMPENVISGGIVGAAEYINGFNRVLFTDEEVEIIGEKIKQAKADMVLFNGICHVRSLKEQFESDTVCPKCGGELVERTGKCGAFLGCSNFPRCRYVKEITD